MGHEGRAHRGEVILAVGAGAELADFGVELAVPLLPLSEGLGAERGVLEKGADHFQLRLFGLQDQRDTNKMELVLKCKTI